MKRLEVKVKFSLTYVIICVILSLVIPWDFAGSGGNRCGPERTDEISIKIQGKTSATLINPQH